jgi:isocitrate/isopropylmalate dehydrogenase
VFAENLSRKRKAIDGSVCEKWCQKVGHTLVLRRPGWLFQPTYGSAPDIMGQDQVIPVAVRLGGGLMFDYLVDQPGRIQALSDAVVSIEMSV